ncbi:MAG: hypothetical protein ACRDNW_22740 [Trebonia sp.]
MTPGHGRPGGQSSQAQAGDQAVDEPVRPQRREDREGDRGQEREHEGHQGQLQRLCPASALSPIAKDRTPGMTAGPPPGQTDA